MKRSLLFGCALVFSAFVAAAQLAPLATFMSSPDLASREDRQALVLPPSSLMLKPSDILPSKPGDMSQMLNFTLRYITRFGPQLEAMNDTKMFVYDPEARRTYIALTTEIPANPNGSGTLGGVAYVVSSGNMGTTWDTTVTFQVPGERFTLPNLGVVSSGGSRYAAMTVVTFGLTDNQIGTLPTRFWFDDGVLPFNEIFTAPATNNSERLLFHTDGQIINYAVDGTPFSLIGGLLGRPSGPATERGGYGHWLYNYDEGDFSATTNIPNQWRKSTFMPATATGWFNSDLQLDVDVLGNLYAAHTTPLAGEPAAGRTPMVSMSNDGGATWSEFSQRRVPQSALDQYAAARSWANIQMYGPYNRDGFVAYGEDRFSYFFRVAQVDGQQRVNALDLVEASYASGQWTVRQVAELQDFAQLLFTYSEDESTQRSRFTLVANSNSVGHEINVAKTADGSSLVVTWTDLRMNDPYTRISPAYTVIFRASATDPWQDVPLDSLANTDMFGAHRRIDGSTWTVLNLTNDNNMEFGTRIPSIVPSINEIPVLSYFAFPRQNLNPQYSLYGDLMALPQAVYNRITWPIGAAFYATASMNVNSVSEATRPLNASIDRIVPNPTISGTEIAWALGEAGFVQISIVNVLGATVKILTSGIQEAGQHAMNVNTSDLPTGTYSVVLTMNGASVSSPMVVVR